jgi:hypothetical protein
MRDFIAEAPIIIVIYANKRDRVLYMVREVEIFTVYRMQHVLLIAIHTLGLGACWIQQQKFQCNQLEYHWEY